VISMHKMPQEVNVSVKGELTCGIQRSFIAGGGGKEAMLRREAL
jgi:hypothetical protein